MVKTGRFRAIKHSVLITENARFKAIDNKMLTIKEDENKQEYPLLKYLQHNKHYLLNYLAASVV